MKNIVFQSIYSKSVINSKIITLFVLIICYLNTNAQCHPGIGFTDQSQIDSFPVLWPNCTEMNGDIFISGNNISNLQGLSKIKYVEDFWIENTTPLQNFTGLDSLMKVKSLTIINNDRIKNFTGLSSLDTIIEAFDISFNDSLINFEGLNSLRYIGGGFGPQVNSSLINFHGLDSLIFMGGYSYIYNNDELKDFTGLGVVRGSTIYIIDNDSIVNFTGLTRLKTCELEIRKNKNLESLTGLESIDTIAGLTIQDNDKLIDISALENTVLLKPHYVHFYNNDILSDCAIQSVCTRISEYATFVDFGGNAPGCNSVEEVDSICDLQDVEELPQQGHFAISPNPAVEVVELKCLFGQAKLIEIEIYNSIGRLVIYEKVPFQDGQAIIPVSCLATGIYLLRTCVSGKVITGRFVKMKFIEFPK